MRNVHDFYMISRCQLYYMSCENDLTFATLNVYRYFSLTIKSFATQIEVNVQRRKNWAKKLARQPQRRAEAFLGTIQAVKF